MIDDLKDDLKSILNDLEKINKASDLEQIVSKIQDFYKKLIIFQIHLAPLHLYQKMKIINLKL